MTDRTMSKILFCSVAGMLTVAVVWVVITGGNLARSPSEQKTERHVKALSGSLGPDFTRQAMQLLDKLSGSSFYQENISEQIRAANALALLGTNAAPAVPILIEKLSSDDNNLAAAAADALVAAGPFAVDDLLKCLHSGDESKRGWAVYGLGEIESSDRRIILGLRGMLLGTNELVVRTTIRALGKKREMGREGSLEIMQFLLHSNPLVRFEAVQALWAIERADHFDKLLPVLGDLPAPSKDRAYRLYDEIQQSISLTNISSNLPKPSPN